MKTLAILLTIVLFNIVSTAQENIEAENIWKMKNYDLIINDFVQDADIVTEGRLLQVIPTGKRRQSYVFVIGIFEQSNETIQTDEKQEVKFSSKKYKPVEFELWADDGGDSLLEYLGCNADLPYMFSDDETKEKYNNPELQPCIGSMIKIKAKKRENEAETIYFLLEAKK